MTVVSSSSPWPMPLLVVESGSKRLLSIISAALVKLPDAFKRRLMASVDDAPDARLGMVQIPVVVL